MRFFKMNGIGNDYIFIKEGDCRQYNLQRLTRKLCDQHTGIGADGLVVFGKSSLHDLTMKIYNRDGSLAQMCGNALRCLIAYSGITGRTVYVETDAGLRSGINHQNTVTANLSNPVSFDTEEYKISIGQKNFHGKRVNMGNPHFVLWRQYNDRLAKSISENTIFFPERTNVEFATEKTMVWT